MFRPILRLGNEALYAVSVTVTQDEVPALVETVQDRENMAVAQF